MDSFNATSLGTILVAEPDTPRRATWAAQLSSEGYNVVSARSGEEAFSIYLADPDKYDLAVIDADLEGFEGGISTARRLLATRPLPILYLSEDPIGDEAEVLNYCVAIPREAAPRLRSSAVRTSIRLFRAQRSLVEQEREYRLLFENMTAGFAVHRMIYDGQGKPVDYRFLAVNPAFERLTGLSAATVVGKTVLEVLPGTEDYWIDTYARVARTGDPTAFRNYSSELDRYYDTWVFSPGPDLFAVVFTDITDKVRAEEELRAREEQFRVLFETMSQGVVFQDAAGRIEMANPAAERILGLSTDQMRGRTAMDPRWRTIREDGSDFPGSEHPVTIALQTGHSVLGTVMGVFLPGTGQYRWIRIDAIPLFKEREIHRVYAMFTDIGTLTKIEESQAFLARRGWDDEGEDFFQALARFLCATLGVDYVCVVRLDEKGVKARSVTVFMDGEFLDNLTCDLADTLCGETVGKRVCCFPRGVLKRFPKDPALQRLPAEGYVGATLWSGEGRPIGVIWAASREALTEPQLAEAVLGLVSIRAAGELERRDHAEALRRLVAQKETLLKELQHRVKNNLNVVSGLLDLEVENLADLADRRIIVEARSRIESIATIYERLYLSEDLATVDLGVYVRDLAASVFKTYEILQGRVRLSVSADQVKLGTKRTVPLGLIINELIANSLKYAYPSGEGELRVTLRRTEGRVELTVSDDGPGLPPEVDPQTATSMGMELVRMLVVELQGTLDYRSGPGLTVRVVFDL